MVRPEFTRHFSNDKWTGKWPPTKQGGFIDLNLSKTTGAFSLLIWSNDVACATLNCGNERDNGEIPPEFEEFLLEYQHDPFEVPPPYEDDGFSCKLK